MDKYYYILENYDGDLSDLLDDHGVSSIDVLVALHLNDVIDCDELASRMGYGKEMEPNSKRPS